MLLREDLAALSALCEEIGDDTVYGCFRSSPAEPSGRLSRRDLWHLSRAARIAGEMGDISAEVADIARRIGDTLEAKRMPGFEACDLWSGAIRWAKRDLIANPPHPSFGPNREREVALAAKRLRSEGYPVTVDAFGCNLADETVLRISRAVNVFGGLLGGIDLLSQLFRILRETGRHHDGFWLFGNQVPSVVGYKEPTLPFGWLLSLGLKHLRAKARPRNPAKLWSRLTTLTRDLAACLDVERHGQLETIWIEADDLPFVIAESLGWQQLFQRPQAPTALISRLADALESLVTEEDRQNLGMNITALAREAERLVGLCSLSTLGFLPRQRVEHELPLVARYGIVLPSERDREPLDPRKSGQSELRSLLFEVGPQTLLALPTSFLPPAAATIIFELIWKHLPQPRAKDLSGDIQEYIVAAACRTRCQDTRPDICYNEDKKRLQIDVATVEPECITLFETKAKSLTAKARSGEIITFLDDYAKSYLALLLQLARHEYHLRAGATPIAQPSESDAIHKVAISPSTYGPISDRALMRSILISLANVRLMPSGLDPKHATVLNDFENAKCKTFDALAKVAVEPDGSFSLDSYMLTVWWLDIGELLYVLDRASSVSSALRPLKHISFASRDFWTEVANADRSALTSDYWRPARGTYP